MVCDFCYITKEEVEATELWVMISYLAIYIGIIFLINLFIELAPGDPGRH